MSYIYILATIDCLFQIESNVYQMFKGEIKRIKINKKDNNYLIIRENKVEKGCMSKHFFENNCYNYLIRINKKNVEEMLINVLLQHNYLKEEKRYKNKNKCWFIWDNTDLKVEVFNKLKLMYQISREK